MAGEVAMAMMSEFEGRLATRFSTLNSQVQSALDKALADIDEAVTQKFGEVRGQFDVERDNAQTMIRQIGETVASLSGENLEKVVRDMSTLTHREETYRDLLGSMHNANMRQSE